VSVWCCLQLLGTTFWWSPGSAGRSGACVVSLFNLTVIVDRYIYNRETYNTSTWVPPFCGAKTGLWSLGADQTIDMTVLLHSPLGVNLIIEKELCTGQNVTF
jgi:hypothetical protein